MTWLSINCRERQGQPNADHHCRVCDCTCHHVPAPVNLRAMVEAAKPDVPLALDPGLWHVHPTDNPFLPVGERCPGWEPEVAEPVPDTVTGGPPGTSFFGIPADPMPKEDE